MANFFRFYLNRINPMTALIMFILTFIILGCAKEEEAPSPPQPPSVAITEVKKTSVPWPGVFVGQAAGSKEVEVHGRVTGILEKKVYTEGSEVKKDDLLFIIDPVPYEIALEKAKGELAKALADETRTQRDRDRVVPLYRQNAVSQKEYDDALAAYDAAKAQVLVAKAQVHDAEINLGYTRVTAPVDGATSKEARSEGSLIIANSDKSLLTTMVQYDPIYVDFSVSGAVVLRMRQLRAIGKLVVPPLDQMQVELTMGDNTKYNRIGRINFFDSKEDPNLASVRGRVEFDNPENIVLPGQFVRVSLIGAKLVDAILVPQHSVLSTQKGSMVYVVDSQNKAQAKIVTLGPSLGTDYLIPEGLEEGDRIITTGAAKVRAGQEVKIVDAKDLKTSGQPPADEKENTEQNKKGASVSSPTNGKTQS